MSANPHANGGLLMRPLRLPDFRDYAVAVAEPGKTLAEATRAMGALLRDVMKFNAEARNFRLMGPDETSSNRLDAVFEVTERVWMEDVLSYNVHLAAEPSAPAPTRAQDQGGECRRSHDAAAA